MDVVDTLVLIATLVNLLVAYYFLREWMFGEKDE